MIIHHAVPGRGFTQIPNGTLRDPALSYAARGLLAEYLSWPDGWRTSAAAVTARARRERGKDGESRRMILAAQAELAKARYLYRDRHRDARGQIVTVLHVFDTPQECDGDGRPLYFRLLGDLTGTPPAGMSVPPAETQESAGRTDIPLADRSVNRHAGDQHAGERYVYKNTGDEHGPTNTVDEDRFAGDEDSSSPVVSGSVEGSANGQVKTDISDEQYAADRAALERAGSEQYSRLLGFAVRELGASAPTRDLIRHAAANAAADAAGRQFSLYEQRAADGEEFSVAEWRALGDEDSP